MYALPPVVSLGHSSVERPYRVKLCMSDEFCGGHPEDSDKNLESCYEMVLS
jgi:hypothetical protein